MKIKIVADSEKYTGNCYQAIGLFGMYLKINYPSIKCCHAVLQPGFPFPSRAKLHPWTLLDYRVPLVAVQWLFHN